MSRITARCPSMHTWTVSAKRPIFTPRLYGIIIWKRVTPDVAVYLARPMVGARFDYCYAVLNGTTKFIVQKLQHVHKSIARVVTGSRRSAHNTPVFARLHWLKIVARIEYIVALLTFICTIYSSCSHQSSSYIRVDG